MRVIPKSYFLIISGLSMFIIIENWSGLRYYCQSDISKWDPFFKSELINETVVENSTQKSVNRTSEKPHNASAAVDESQNITYYITVKDMTPGRLGNHMFIYAALYGLARMQGRKMFVPHVSDLEKAFKIRHVGANKDANTWPVIKEAGPVVFDAKLTKLPLKNLRIPGHFQSFRYFKDVQDEIRQEFTFQDSVANEADRILHDLYATNKGSLVVGVHVRRGDFLSKQFENWGYGVPEKSYFIKAFDWMRAKFPGRNITFLVASDDFKWCNENLIGKGVVALPSASPEVHMAILASCNHVIITGGTYGYWCAFLARGGYVIYYTGYLARNTYLGKNFIPNDYYPPLWIGFGN